jgi:uncharacterized membrane protein YczE
LSVFERLRPTAPGRADAPRLGRRLLRLYAGLPLYGASCALLVRADLGLGPWDVLHQGISRQTGLTIGTVSIALGALVLLLWIPIRERPGLGTVSNVVLVGLSLDATLALVPPVEAPAVRVPLMAVAVALNGAATGLYISARFGAGPRDGLMTGLHRVTGRSVRVVRTGIEITVLMAGLLLGGTAGVGTVLYAVSIGPLSQLFLRLFEVRSARGPASSRIPDGADRGGGPEGERDQGRKRGRGKKRGPERERDERQRDERQREEAGAP